MRSLFLALFGFVCLGAHAARAAVPEVITINSVGEFSNGPSGSPAISADGDVVVFESKANNLAAGDLREINHIYVLRRSTGSISRVSQSTEGAPGNADSAAPSVSPDGRYVVFESSSSNLVTGDENGRTDVFLHDLSTGETRRISSGLDSTEAAGDSESARVSRDGEVVVFVSDAPNLVSNDTNQVKDIFVWTRSLDTTQRVSLNAFGEEADRGSRQPDISADGRYIVFASDATNLVSKDVNGARDIFFFDREGSSLRRVSVDSNGNQSSGNCIMPSVSDDGRFVAFESTADDLDGTVVGGVRNIYLRDRIAKQTQLVSAGPSGAGNADSTKPDLSGDGRYVVFESLASNLILNDTNELKDVFVYVRTDETVQRLSTDSLGKGGTRTSESPVVSSRGEVVVFASSATFLQSVTNETVNIFAVPFDLCVDDDFKREAGTCGCGVQDVDLDGDGFDDCLAPDEDLVPSPPVVFVAGNLVRVSGFQSFDLPVSYRVVFSLKQGKRYKKTREFRGSGSFLSQEDFSDGRWRVRYRIVFGSGDSEVVSMASPPVGFRVGEVGVFNSDKPKRKRRRRKRKQRKKKS